MRALRSFWFVPVAAMLFVAGCGGGDAANQAESAANPCAANPCAANPCAADAANPCAADAANPCAANPCAADAANPCAANPCAANPCAGMDMPDWFKMDEAAKTVTLDIAAGSNDANNHWNFNGYHGGNATIVVPEGYTVTINFKNSDPLTTHSIGVDAMTGDFPSVFDDPAPVFDGAISPNPTSMTDATASGESATLTFVASASGDYTLVCYIPGHAVTGMYIGFKVSSDGSAGVITM